MHKLLFIALLLLSPVMATHAQSTPAKKALAARILKVQQPGIEELGRSMAERPAVALMQRAGSVLPERVAADKREAVGKEIQGDIKKYLDDTVPLVANRAVKLAPATVGVFLEEKFTEEELKQIAAFLESPAVGKFQSLSGDMQKVLLEKVVADTRGIVEPKLVALENSVSKRLGLDAPAAAVK